LAIFLVDRLVWRLSLKSETFTADLEVLEDEQTLLLSVNWSIPHQSDHPFGPWLRQGIRHGWKPMDHVFITMPSLGRTHLLQTHPFTIASAAPKPRDALDTETPHHAWLSLLIRARDGFTRDLLQYSLSRSSIPVRMDGPYGSAEALEMLRACESRVLIAGGSGIAVVFPLAWALAQHPPPGGGAQSRRKDIHLLWVVHSRSHLSWLPQERLDELAEAGVHVTTPGPTAEAGRPDIAGYVAEMSNKAQMRRQELGVVVSGPDNLNRAARNACALAVKDGANIRLSVEKFGW